MCWRAGVANCAWGDVGYNMLLSSPIPVDGHENFGPIANKAEWDSRAWGLSSSGINGYLRNKMPMTGTRQ